MSPARALMALLAVGLLVMSAPAAAHAIGISRGEYSLGAGTLDVGLTFARGDALLLAPSLDADGDGVLTANEVARGATALTRGMVDRLPVSAVGAPCHGALRDARLTEGDGLSVALHYECAAHAGVVDVDVDPLLEELGTGHRHLAHLAGKGDVVLFHRSSTCQVAAAAAPSANEHAPDTSTPWIRAASIFRMGVEHILTGYDHLLFLFGLVLVARTWRSLLPVVTAFTVAHSLTLGIAALGFWTPPSRVVEPLIALSIAYVGVENLFMKDATKRWRVTFPFGLIHGFGFASALRELDLPARQLPVALVSFNVGVEVGQLAVLAAILPLVAAIRSRGWFSGIRIPSLGVAAIGAVWFVARVV